MADKSEFVDLIGEATRQNRRRAMPVDVDPLPTGGSSRKRSRMASTPPRMERWRMETLTPWKIKMKSWKFVNWD
ncbi:MAG: hypothetical protein AB7I42_07815 [Bradyrhizobium sp.]|uniref:hypothetical protein n=1 Tax=Bradyrhizobium sp. TaxID=376 RepID=UPI002A276D89|nr:hypothetical protein [Bradyrhizobium sp.]